MEDKSGLLPLLEPWYIVFKRSMKGTGCSRSPTMELAADLPPHPSASLAALMMAAPQMRVSSDVFTDDVVPGNMFYYYRKMICSPVTSINRLVSHSLSGFWWNSTLLVSFRWMYYSCPSSKEVKPSKEEVASSSPSVWCSVYLHFWWRLVHFLPFIMMTLSSSSDVLGLLVPSSSAETSRSTNRHLLPLLWAVSILSFIFPVLLLTEVETGVCAVLWLSKYVYIMCSTHEQFWGTLPEYFNCYFMLPSCLTARQILLPKISSGHHQLVCYIKQIQYIV